MRLVQIERISQQAGREDRTLQTGALLPMMLLVWQIFVFEFGKGSPLIIQKSVDFISICCVPKATLCIIMITLQSSVINLPESVRLHEN